MTPKETSGENYKIELIINAKKLVPPTFFVLSWHPPGAIWISHSWELISKSSPLGLQCFHKGGERERVTWSGSPQTPYFLPQKFLLTSPELCFWLRKGGQIVSIIEGWQNVVSGRSEGQQFAFLLRRTKVGCRMHRKYQINSKKKKKKEFLTVQTYSAAQNGKG